MAYNLARTELVRQLIGPLPDVRERKMFGSIGFIVNGKLCIGVGDHEDHVMMVRVGPNKYEEALGKQGAHPAIMRGREMKGYVFLDESAVETDEMLSEWVEMALEYNRTITTVTS